MLYRGQPIGEGNEDAYLLLISIWNLKLLYLMICVATNGDETFESIVNIF